MRRRPLAVARRPPEITRRPPVITRRPPAMTRDAAAMGRSAGTRRAAFTVLELMISLALLGALLAVAWSILGSYRLSEQRGWDQAYRMQVVRTVRELIESDASHLSGGEPIAASGTTGAASGTTGAASLAGRLGNVGVGSNSVAVSPPGIGFDSEASALVGDADGFSVVMRPSIDPLPWLEKVTETEPDASAAWAETVSGGASDRHRPLGIRDSVRLSYRLFDEGESLASALGGGVSGPNTGGSLTGSEIGTGASAGGGRRRLRRHLVPTGNASGSNVSGGSGSAGDDAIDPDRELTVEDLYRVDESERVESAAAIDTVWIRHLVDARFRYSDGAEWRDEWDGRLGGGLPVAIELSFDHPRASSPYAVEPGPGAGVANGSGLTGGSGPTGLTGGNASASGDLDVRGRDVRIVVLVPGAKGVSP